ncbi:MAG: hypothetical protein QOJ39_1126 [Candidatus Eremiobacteraeota bacterium]|nr:hypothetical protein [Candidatus Eremiobacteraeota bacterium]
MPNEARVRPHCAHGCGRRIRPQSVAFCSRFCLVEHYSERVISLWRAGELPPRLYFNRTVRRHIIESVGERCQLCGWCERNRHTGLVPLEIEHIDGDWKNNHPENIRVLCPNCHALTPTFRGANRGRGRPGRSGWHPTTSDWRESRSRNAVFGWVTMTDQQPLFSPFPGLWNGRGTLGRSAPIMASRERPH